MDKRILIFILAVGFLPPSPPLCFSDDDLRVEGIVYEASHPEEAMAIVNGALIKKDDPIQDYVVKEVQQSKVIFKTKEGVEKTVMLLAPKSSSAPTRPAGPNATHKKVEKKSFQQEESQNNTPEKTGGLKSPFDFLNSSGFAEKLASISVIMDLRNIRMAVAQQYMENGSFPSIEEMVKNGSLNPIFENGVKGNYQYSTANGAKGDPVVYADPVDESSGLPHYMIDEWGNVRTEKDKKATSKSPVYQGFM